MNYLSFLAVLLSLGVCLFSSANAEPPVSEPITAPVASPTGSVEAEAKKVGKDLQFDVGGKKDNAFICKYETSGEQYDQALHYVFGDIKGGKDDKKAFVCFDAAAKLGHVDAQYNLGLFYGYGTGVSRDSEQSRYWLEQAAKQDHSHAQLNLGTLYEFGEGVSQDKTLARYWYEKSAELGDEQAQYFLALIYEDGAGIPKDLVVAYKWALIAHQNKHLSAESLSQKLAGKLTVAERLQGEEAAKTWTPRNPRIFSKDENGLQVKQDVFPTKDVRISRRVIKSVPEADVADETVTQTSQDARTP